MQRLNEVESVFLSDIREKKKETASVKAALKHKKLGKNSMKFPSDLMSRKERMEHRRSGTVTTTNLFDQILTIDEFNKLETYEKKNRMQYWRSKYTIKEIFGSLGIAQATYYKILAELELPRDRAATQTQKEKKPRAAKAVVAVSKKKTLLEAAEEIAAPPAPVEPAAPPVQEIVLNGLNVSFNGTYDAELIQKQLLKILTLLDGENDQYYVEMKLMQKVK